MFETIFKEFGIDANASVKPFGSGLINNTWLISENENDLILQRINHNVFKQPFDIATNIQLICEYLRAQHPGYLFIAPRKTIAGDEMIFIKDEGYFRIFPFIKNSHTTDVVVSPSQAFEAAKQFGRFTNLLSAFPVNKLKITLPDFHNLPLRYAQFETAIKEGNKERIKQSAIIISFLKNQYEIVSISEQISNNPGFKKKVTHHDSKISNVLFDKNNRGLCVIDLDTVMPGYFISDFGDMMRTYLSPVSEEEKDLTKIEIRDEYFKAIADGYLSEMENELSAVEKKYLVYAGKFMIYMQALRFLTDHLNNDVYYGAKYDGHNFVRANSQATLLKKIIEKEKLLEELVGSKP
ncbi:MAG TPA: aminoglycoside phosphotransferase family protein [Chitinophagaceae bacterium]|nr:aminoglycoside phosphotransferase family protein [Chitinophagaceae bacterium]